MLLAGQRCSRNLCLGSVEERKLGAQLLLSEVLEYVIKGLGVIPKIGDRRLENPDEVDYLIGEAKPDAVQMLDGLADVAYTMYWNAEAFGLPLEEAFEAVCDNNLEKFVKLEGWSEGAVTLDRPRWDCKRGIKWPSEVTKVEVLEFNGEFYAVGKDSRGKVRKPSSYRQIDLTSLIERREHEGVKDTNISAVNR